MVAREWRFTLEKSASGGLTQKDSVKEPLGFKQDFTDVSVRASTKSNSSQVELLENVIIFNSNLLRKRGPSPNRH